ncbi:MAG TPA: hypothetical protein VLA74_09110 [Nitrososphaeraceae archaeon]|nr:hypothetical protein [Nitrososphaeraceae archaeon]
MNYFFLVIFLSIVLVIFNTHTHSLFAEQQNLKTNSNYQLSLNFSSQQEKELFLQKWLNFSPSKEIKEVPKTQITLAIYTLNDLVNELVTGVKLENITTVPNQVKVNDIFEVNATVRNTLPFNVTIIAGNCNSDFSTNFYNNVEEIEVPQCMNRVLPTVLEPRDKVTVQESSGIGKQYNAVAEGEANGTAILSYSIEVKPEGFLETTSLKGQVVQPFSFTILP